MKKFLIPFLFAFFSAAGLAQSAAPEFDDIDTDADGILSQTEVDAAAVEGLDFASADMDGNGSLSRDEYDSAVGNAGEDAGSTYGTESTDGTDSQ